MKKKYFFVVIISGFILLLFYLFKKPQITTLIKDNLSKKNVEILRLIKNPINYVDRFQFYKLQDSLNINGISGLNKILVKKEIEFQKIHDTIFELENNLKFDFQQFNFNSLFPSKNGTSRNTTYVEVSDDEVFLVSGSGVFLKSTLKELYEGKGKFNLINSNISDFVNYDDFYENSWYGVKDVFISENNIYVSFSNQMEEDCYNTSILVAEINNELKFEMFFEDSECILEKNEYGEYNAHQSGGRIVGFKDNELLFSIGEYRYRTKAQNKENLFGKIISINKESKETRIISLGHRNVQGLKFIKDMNIIISTEHGPFGGDEINIQKNIDSLHNFGWPISSYGYHYSTRNGFGEHYKGDDEEIIEVLENSPLHKSHSKYGFVEPFKFFVPSIGISEVDYLKTNSQMYLIVASMGNDIEEGDMSLHIINIEKIEDSNIIPLNNRIRDIKKIDNTQTYLLTFESNLNGGGIGLFKKSN